MIITSTQLKDKNKAKNRTYFNQFQLSSLHKQSWQLINNYVGKKNLKFNNKNQNLSKAMIQSLNLRKLTNLKRQKLKISKNGLNKLNKF